MDLDLRPVGANLERGTRSNALSAARIHIMSVRRPFSVSSGPMPGPGMIAVSCSHSVSGEVSFGSGGQNDDPSGPNIGPGWAWEHDYRCAVAVRQPDHASRGQALPSCIRSRITRSIPVRRPLFSGDLRGRIRGLDRIAHGRHGRPEDDRRDRQGHHQLHHREASFARVVDLGSGVGMSHRRSQRVSQEIDEM